MLSGPAEWIRMLKNAVLWVWAIHVELHNEAARCHIACGCNVVASEELDRCRRNGNLLRLSEKAVGYR
jgi:hypothetical protein